MAKCGHQESGGLCDLKVLLSYFVFLVYFAVRPAEKRKQPRTENVFVTGQDGGIVSASNAVAVANHNIN